jgi:hypothetical protein
LTKTSKTSQFYVFYSPSETFQGPTACSRFPPCETGPRSPAADVDAGVQVPD